MSIEGKKIGPWDDLIIRSIAIYKFLKGVLALILAGYIFKLIHDKEPDVLATLLLKLHVNLEAHLINKIFNAVAPFIDQHIHTLGIGVLLYAINYLAEGVGLYYRKTWAEYLVIVETSLPLPLEIYEVFFHTATWNICVLIGNIFILIYLIRRLYKIHNLEVGEKVLA